MPNIIKRRIVVSSSMAKAKVALQQGNTITPDTVPIYQRDADYSIPMYRQKKKTYERKNMFWSSVLCLFFCLTYLLVGRSVIKQIYCFLCERFFFQPIPIGRTNRQQCIIASFRMGHFSRLSLTVFPSSNFYITKWIRFEWRWIVCAAITGAGSIRTKRFGNLSPRKQRVSISTDKNHLSEMWAPYPINIYWGDRDKSEDVVWVSIAYVSIAPL